MKKTLTLFVATIALTGAIGFLAWSAMQPSADGFLKPIAAFFEKSAQAVPLFLASGDDADDDHRYRKSSRRGHDDAEKNDDKDERRSKRSGVGKSAPAETAAPPQNGLFGNGAPPKAQVN